jgi:hypothetical protein
MLRRPIPLQHLPDVQRRARPIRRPWQGNDKVRAYAKPILRHQRGLHYVVRRTLPANGITRYRPSDNTDRISDGVTMTYTTVKVNKL